MVQMLCGRDSVAGSLCGAGGGPVVPGSTNDPAGPCNLKPQRRDLTFVKTAAAGAAFDQDLAFARPLLEGRYRLWTPYPLGRFGCIQRNVFLEKGKVPSS